MNENVENTFFPSFDLIIQITQLIVQYLHSIGYHVLTIFASTVIHIYYSFVVEYEVHRNKTNDDDDDHGRRSVVNSGGTHFWLGPGGRLGPPVGVGGGGEAPEKLRL